MVKLKDICELSPREVTIMDLLVENGGPMSLNDLAARLGVAHSTTQAALANARFKLFADSTAEAIKIWKARKVDKRGSDSVQ